MSGSSFIAGNTGQENVLFLCFKVSHSLFFIYSIFKINKINNTIFFLQKLLA